MYGGMSSPTARGWPDSYHTAQLVIHSMSAACRGCSVIWSAVTILAVKVG